MAWQDTLPEDWSGRTAEQKINYFNTQGITPSQLSAIGVSPQDLNWMQTAGGYTVNDPQAQTAGALPSVSSVAPTAVTPAAQTTTSGALTSATQTQPLSNEDLLVAPPPLSVATQSKDPITWDEGGNPIYGFTNPTGGQFNTAEEAQADYDRQKQMYPGASDADINVNKWVYGREPVNYQNLYRAVQTGKATVGKVPPEQQLFDGEGYPITGEYGVFDENGKLIPFADVDPKTGIISVGTSNGVLRMATPIGQGGVLSPIKGEDYANQVKYQSFGHDDGLLGFALTAASLFPSPIQPFAQAANAAYQASQGNELGAILSGLGAAGTFTGNELLGMTNPSSATAVSGLDLASDIATLGSNPALALQTTLSDINLAKTAVSGLNAAATGNVAGLINSAMSGYTQLGGTLPSGLTTGLQVANLASALDRGDAAGALNVASDLTGSGDAKVAASAVQVLDALKSGNPGALISAATNFGKTTDKTQADASMPGGGYQYSSLGTPFSEKTSGITARTYDDTIVQAGADAFIKAKEAGASDSDALAAANAVTQQEQPKYDQGEFAGLEEAQKAAKESSTVNISNAEADTPEEAMALAKARDPNAMYFNYGGSQYTISASPDQMADVTKQAQLAEIRDLPTFNEAFAKARNVLGPNQTFDWNGKQYSTATFSERPDLSGNVVPGAESTTAGAGRGSYAGYSSAEEMVNKVKSTPSSTEYGGAKILGIPVGTPQDALDTVNRMGDVVLDFSRGIGAGFGNFMNQVGTLAHIASASLSGGDTKDTLIAKDNLLSTLGKDLAGYYNGMTTEESKKEWKNIVSDVKNAPEYLKPFVAVKSTLQNFGGFVNQLGAETGEEVAPLLTGLGIGSKILQLGASGTAKTIAVTTTLGDMAESAQGSYDNVMERLKDNKNLTDEEKHWKATQAAAGSMAATAVFGYGANSYLAKSIMGDMIATPAQKVLGPLAVEYITEYPESFVQTLNERFAEKGSIDANDLKDANTDGAISALLGAKTSGTITGAVQVVGKVTNEFVGAESGDKSGLAIIQSPDGKIGFVPAGDLKIGQEVNADELNQLQSSTDFVDQFNFNPEQSARISESVEQLDLTRIDRQEQSDQEATNFDASQIDIGSALGSGVGAESSSVANVDAGVTAQTSTSVDPKTGVTTQTTTDSKTGVTTNTSVDANTGINTQTSTNPNNNTQTTTTTDSNTNTTTQTVVNANTNTTTETSVNNNTNVTTEVTNNTNTETTVSTDINNNTQTTVVVDTKTGDVIKKEITDIPPDWKTPDITPVTPQVTPPTPPVSPPTTPSVTPTSVTKFMDSGLAGAGAIGLPSYFGLGPEDLPSRVTQKAIDPIARVMEAQAELEKTAMMQQIDPRLLGILQQRAAPEQQASQQQQFDRDIGALAQVLSGQPTQASNDRGYYSYGAEDSIDDILGGKAANYAEGGYVAPLMAEGGMALPLLAKSGGALGHYGGREDFKDGKHVAGEGDGQSDDIPAWLADSEFVLPADVVAALGNGSTKAGTNKLYEMMHAIRARARSTGPEDLPPPALKSPLDYLKSHKRSQ